MQLAEAEKRLQDSQSKLARLRGRDTVSSRSSQSNETKTVKVERRSTSPDDDEGHSRRKPQSKPELLIPSVTPKISRPIKPSGSGMKVLASPTTQGSPSCSNSVVRVKEETSCRRSPDRRVVDGQDRGTKRKFGNILTF